MVLGRYSEAMAAYRRVLDLEPDRAMTLVPMAVIYKKQGRPADGLRLLDSAVSAAPRVAYARAIRSYHRSELGQVEGARHDADTALALDSNFRIPALGALAKAEWMLGDTIAAKRHVAEAERAIAIPGTPTPTEAYMISQALVAAGRFDRAVVHLRGARPRGAWLWFLFTNPDLERLRAMPEAAAILAEADPRTR